MTEKQISQIILDNKIPKDELDTDKYYSYLILGMITLVFLIPLLPFVDDKTSISLEFKLIGVIIGVILLILTFRGFKTEKKLKSIVNKLDKINNHKLIEAYLNDNNISFKKYKHYYTAYLRTIFNTKGLKLIIIPLDEKIAFNIRTIYYSIDSGRIPFSKSKRYQKKKLSS